MNPAEVIESFIDGNLTEEDACYFLWYHTGTNFTEGDLNWLVEGYRQETVLH